MERQTLSCGFQHTRMYHRLGHFPAPLQAPPCAPGIWDAGARQSKNNGISTEYQEKPANGHASNCLQTEEEREKVQIG